MDFLGLRIHNFMSIGSAPSIDLSQKGLVLVCGVNKDDSSAVSNGVGKSSIPDALCWALYGQTARGVTGDAVVNNVDGKNCFVQTFIQDGAYVYSVTRYRKHAEFKNSTRVTVCEAKDFHSEGVYSPVDMTKGTEAETQEVINQIMGCSLDVFAAAIYAGQEIMPDLPKMTDKNLKALIEEAAGISRIQKAYEIARENHNTATRQFASLISAAAVKHEAEKAADSNYAYALEQEKTYEDSRPARRDAIIMTRTEMEKGLKEKLLALKALPKAEDLQAQVAELDQQLDAVKPLNEKSTALAGEVSTIASSYKFTRNEYLALVDAVGKIDNAIANAPEAAKKPCGSCGKPFGTDKLAEFVEHQNAKLIETRAALAAKAAELEALKAKHEAAIQSFEQHSATIPDISAVNAEKTRINAVIVQSTRLSGEIKALTTERSNLITREAEAMMDLNPHSGTVTVRSNEVVIARAAHAEALAAAEAFTSQVEIAKASVDIFGPAGVRAHILDTVTPFLNDRTQEYLSLLSDGNITAIWSTLSETAKGELREKFNIEVTNRKGADSFAGLSGGEKRKVRLSTMLALQDMVASRATKPINLWIGDEIDDALDVAGLERLMVVLERKARERGTVLVVSHNDLKDWIDNSVTVTKVDGKSTIEGELCAY